MKIVADENLAFTEYFFSEFGTIHQAAGRNLTHHDVNDADALLVRSITKVNEQLIQDTALKFVGSATIGTDHLDIPALEKHQIAWSNAAGCNAQAVAEYVITALLYLNQDFLDLGKKFTLGIIGLGNVGTRLAYMAQLLGWNASVRRVVVGLLIGSKRQRLTALSASRSNTRGGLARSTRASVTEPSVPTVSSTSTSPEVPERSASAG